MTEASVSFAGNLTDQPEVRYTEGGIARAMFRVAVSGRREQEPSFFAVVVWRDQAEHAAQSLAKGSRVVVVGQLSQRLGTLHGGTHLDLWKCRLPSRNCGGWWRSWLVGGLPAPGPAGQRPRTAIQARSLPLSIGPAEAPDQGVGQGVSPCDGAVQARR
jgi:Single-strand binding protein family